MVTPLESLGCYDNTVSDFRAVSYLAAPASYLRSGRGVADGALSKGSPFRRSRFIEWGELFRE